MSRDYTLPLETDWTVDDLAILPARCRYELIDGRLHFRRRDSLARLAGLALMAELKAACPPGFQVRSRADFGAAYPVPDLAVFNPEGSAVLVADVLQPGRHLAEMVDRVRAHSARGVPRCWILETLEEDGVILAEVGIAAGGGLEVESSTSDIFTTDRPFPVSIDLPLISDHWPQTFEYIGPDIES